MLKEYMVHMHLHQLSQTSKKLRWVMHPSHQPGGTATDSGYTTILFSFDAKTVLGISTGHGINFINLSGLSTENYSELMN